LWSTGVLDVGPAAPAPPAKARARLATDLTAAAGVNLLGPLREEGFRWRPRGSSRSRTSTRTARRREASSVALTPRGCLWDKRATSSRRPEEPPGGDVSLRCPSCGRRNRADRRYCAACGSHLGQACPSCGTRNNPEEKFCGAC